MKVLILAPLHDLATSISNKAGHNLVKWIKSENKRRVGTGFELIKYKFLGGLNANRLSVWFNRNVDAVFYMGHGLKDRLGDTFMKILPILDKHNIHWFKDKIIYTMSCLSGLELAQYAIERGVKAYYGQVKKYYGYLPRKSKKYAEDWEKLITIIPKRLMMGATTYEAMDAYDTFSAELHQKYQLESTSENAEILFSNAYNMNLYGSQNIKV